MSKKLQFQLHVKSRIGFPVITADSIQYAAPSTIKLETEKIIDVKTGVMIAKCKPDGCVKVTVIDELADKIDICNNIFGPYYQDELVVRLSNASQQFLRIDQGVIIFKYQWVSSRPPVTSKKSKAIDAEVVVTSQIGVYNQMPEAGSEFAGFATNIPVPEQENTTIIQANEKNNFHNIVISEETSVVNMNPNTQMPPTTTVVNPTFATNQPVNDGLAKAGYVPQNSEIAPTRVRKVKSNPNSAPKLAAVPVPISYHSGETFAPVDGGSTTVHDASAIQNPQVQAESRYAMPAEQPDGQVSVETDLSGVLTPQQGLVPQNSQIAQQIPEETKTQEVENTAAVQPTGDGSVIDAGMQKPIPQGSTEAATEESPITGAPVQQLPIASDSSVTEPVVQPREGQDSVTVETFLPNIKEDDANQTGAAQATPVVQTNPPQDSVSMSTDILQHDAVTSSTAAAPANEVQPAQEVNPIETSEELVQPSQDAQAMVQEVNQPVQQTQEVTVPAVPVQQAQQTVVAPVPQQPNAGVEMPVIQDNPPQTTATPSPELVVHDGGVVPTTTVTQTTERPIVETSVVETEVEQVLPAPVQQDASAQAAPEPETKVVESTEETTEVSGGMITGAQPDIDGMTRKRPVRRTLKKRIDV